MLTCHQQKLVGYRHWRQSEKYGEPYQERLEIILDKSGPVKILLQHFPVRHFLMNTDSFCYAETKHLPESEEHQAILPKEGLLNLEYWKFLKLRHFMKTKRDDMFLSQRGKFSQRATLTCSQSLKNGFDSIDDTGYGTQQLGLQRSHADGRNVTLVTGKLATKLKQLYFHHSKIILLF